MISIQSGAHDDAEESNLHFLFDLCLFYIESFRLEHGSGAYITVLEKHSGFE